MNAPLTRRAAVGLGFATAGCLMIGLYAVALTASGFAMLPDDVAANGLPWALRAHIATAGVALLLVPWQVWPAIRRRTPSLHRWIGRGYVIAALAGGVSGFLAALQVQSGPVAAVGFAVLGVLWTASTAMAYHRARSRDHPAHRRWALRSFALAFAAVTLRVYLPVAGALGFDFDSAYAVVAWVSWLPNLWLVERHLGRLTPAPKASGGAARIEAVSEGASR